MVRTSLADRAMPLQNRVTPEGEIIATPHRGLMMGNRGGCFHLPDRTLGARRWATRQWIACVLEFKGRHRQAMMQPNRYTELFFLDEATALDRRPSPLLRVPPPRCRAFCGAVGPDARVAGTGPGARDGRDAPCRAGRRAGAQDHLPRPTRRRCRTGLSCASPTALLRKPILLTTIAFLPGPRLATERPCRPPGDAMWRC